MNILIKGGHVIDIKTGLDKVADVLISSGTIAEIGDDIDSTGCEIVDCEGLYVLPGLIDAHCHLRDPGFEYKEDIETGTMSAAKGGFTSIACMPNTKPVIDNEAIINYINKRVEEDGYVNVFPIGAVTKGLKGQELSEIGELKFAGAVALSDDGNPIESSSIMKKALIYSEMFDITIISHCEDKDVAEDGVMNEGYNSTIMGLRGIPSAAEEIMVARDLILSEYTGVKIHIAHVSTKLSVDMIRNAKKRGVKVTCETCPQYFSLTDDACLGYNTLAKINPPLRSKEDVEAIIRGLADGTIDIIATDHAPHNADEKNVEFDKAANGMVGFETAVPLALTNLYHTGRLTLKQIVEKMTVNPAKLLGLTKGTIEVGKTADLTIVDLNEKNTVNTKKFLSKSKNSPLDGYNTVGAVKHTIVNGALVVRDSILL